MWLQPYLPLLPNEYLMQEIWQKERHRPSRYGATTIEHASFSSRPGGYGT